MGRRGRNRDWRNKILANLEEAEPEVHAELIELRSTNPQAYRKQLRYWVQYYPIERPQKVMANRAAIWRGKMLGSPEEVVAAPFQQARQAIRQGNMDDRLDQIEALERAGRNRPVIFEILQRRRDLLAAPPEERPPAPPVATGWTQKRASSESDS